MHLGQAKIDLHYCEVESLLFWHVLNVKTHLKLNVKKLIVKALIYLVHFLESSSLKDYLEKMDLDYLIENEDQLNQQLASSRTLKRKKSLVQMVLAMDTYIATMQAIKELNLSSLP